MYFQSSTFLCTSVNNRRRIDLCCLLLVWRLLVMMMVSVSVSVSVIVLELALELELQCVCMYVCKGQGKPLNCLRSLCSGGWPGLVQQKPLSRGCWC